MPTSHRKFGDLLEEGIKRVHITRKKPIGYILDEFGYELRPDDSSKGRHALGHWYYKKRIPANMADVAKLAELIVTNSDVERDWLKAFLDSAGFPEADKLCDRFFVPGSGKIHVVNQPSPELAGISPDLAQSRQAVRLSIRTKRSRLSYLVGALALLSVVVVILWSQRPVTKLAIGASPTGMQVSQPISSTATATVVVTATLSIEKPTIQPVTPTLDFSSFDGKCPTVSPTSVFEYTSSQSFRDFLNSGGSFVALQSGFNALVQKKAELRDGRISNVDLTGDGVSEVIISAILEKSSIWQILGCNSGRYEALSDMRDPDFRYLRFAVDLNGDKLPEVIGYRETQPESTRLFEFFVQGWNGHQFVDLIDDTRFNEVGKHLPIDITDWQKTVANATIRTGDTNRDGLYEVIVIGGLITPVPTCETRFERQFTEIWGWNGRSFQFVERVYMMPIYRFQRSADGDLAFALKQFDLALKSYQDVLFDENLFKRDQYLSHLEYCKGIGPAIDPELIENEQDQLEAYARWRILLIHTITGSQDAMQVVYQTLQDKFPDGRPGHSYAFLATVFWEQYEISQSIELACEAVIVAAKDQQLYPSHVAENICFMP